MNKFKLFCTLVFIGLLCSFIPFGPTSMLFGFPAVILNSLILTFLSDKLVK